MLEPERRQTSNVSGEHLVALGAEPIERGVHVDRVPQHHEVDHDAERAEMVYLPFAVALAQLAALALGGDQGKLVAAFAAIELDQNAPAIALVVDEPQEVERLHQPPELLERVGELGRTIVGLKHPGELDRAHTPSFSDPLITQPERMMPTDTSCFANRVRGIDPFAGSLTDAAERLLGSCSVLLRQSVFQPLMSGYDAIRFAVMNEVVVEAHDAVSMALGRQRLFAYTRKMMEYDECYAEDALNFLSNRRAPALERLSLAEMIMRSAAPHFGARLSPVEAQLSELLQTHTIRLVFRNGRFEPSDGPMVEQAVHDPFWDLVADTLWDNVRIDMQQALTLRNSGGPNPAFYAARAGKRGQDHQRGKWLAYRCGTRRRKRDRHFGKCQERALHRAVGGGHAQALLRRRA